MPRIASIFFASLTLGSLVACGDKSEDEEEEDDESSGTVYTGPCPQVDLGSAVGETISSGSTSGADNDWGECGEAAVDSSDDSGNSDGQAPDVSLVWVAPDSGVYTAHTNDSDFDTLLTLIVGGCTGEVVECDDDGGRNLASAITFDATAGQAYVFIVDGYDRSEDGDWAFSIIEGSPDWGYDSGQTELRSRPLRKGRRTVVPEVRTRFGPTGVDVEVTGGAGGWMLGVARTADPADPHAFLADCHAGALVNGSWQSACQPIQRGNNPLTYGGDPMSLGHGMTLLRPDDAAGVTWMLESDRSLGGDGRCFVWGHDPAAFASLSCIEL